VSNFVNRQVTHYNFTLGEDVSNTSLRQYTRRPTTAHGHRLDSAHQHGGGRRRRRGDGDLRRQEGWRQPAANRRTALTRFARDQRLEQRTYSCAGRVAIAAFLECPRFSGDADDDVGRGRCSFLGDEKMQLPRAGRSETGEQSLPGDRVLNEVGVALQVEAARLVGRRRHAPPHRTDRRQIRSRRPAPSSSGRHDDDSSTLLVTSQGDRVEAGSRVVLEIRSDEQERHLRSGPRGLIEQRLARPRHDRGHAAPGP
jgi:hypothetical protein